MAGKTPFGAPETQGAGRKTSHLQPLCVRFLLATPNEMSRRAANFGRYGIQPLAESPRGPKAGAALAWLAAQNATPAEIARLLRLARGAPLVAALSNANEALAQRLIESGVDDCVPASGPESEIAFVLHRAAARGRHRAKISAELSLVQEVAEGLVVLDHDGAVRFANDAAENLLGAAPGSLLGRKFTYPLVENETVAIDLPRGAGGEGAAELRVIETDWGGVRAKIASIADVTARRALERARDAMLARGFAGEVRTALTTIIGLAELMLAGKSGPLASPRHAEYLNDIRDSGEALLALLKSLGRPSPGPAQKIASSF